ncbi:uncharacterized protein LOC144075306 [Stigmatopora argus]
MSFTAGAVGTDARRHRLRHARLKTVSQRCIGQRGRGAGREERGAADPPTATKLGLTKYFRCLSPPKSTSAGCEPASTRWCLSRRRRERHQEYVCGMRTSFHSVVGAYSTVCAKGPTHTPTKLRPAKYFRDKLEEVRNPTDDLLCGELVLSTIEAKSATW